MGRGGTLFFFWPIVTVKCDESPGRQGVPISIFHDLSPFDFVKCGNWVQVSPAESLDLIVRGQVGGRVECSRVGEGGNLLFAGYGQMK